MAEIKSQARNNAALDQTPEPSLKESFLPSGNLRPEGLDIEQGVRTSLNNPYRPAAEKFYMDPNQPANVGEMALNGASNGSFGILKDLVLRRNGAYNHIDLKAIDELKVVALGLMKQPGEHREKAADAYEALSSVALRMRDGQKFADPNSSTGSPTERANYQLLIDTYAKLDAAMSEFMITSVYNRNAAISGGKSEIR